MTHHCPRSNWTGPESELRRGICPKCAGTTLYEDCSVRPMAITFTDGEGRFHVLRVDDESNATPDDLARAGYEPPLTVRGHIDLLRSLGYFVENPKAIDSEIRALRALEAYVRSPCGASPEPWPTEESVSRTIRADEVAKLLEAIDEARK